MKNKKSIILIIISCILLIVSAYAWFVNNSTSNTIIQANIKSWDIEIGKEKEYELDVGDIYPGMSSKTDTAEIKNTGDFDAILTYKLKDIKLFGKFYTIENGDDVEKILADCPFDVTIEFSNTTVPAQGSVDFKATITWEYEEEGTENEITEKDVLDTKFGNDAAKYNVEGSNVIIGVDIIAQQVNN